MRVRVIVINNASGRCGFGTFRSRRGLFISVEGGFRLWFSSEECAGVWLPDGGFDGGKVSEAHVLCTRNSCCLAVRQSPILSD